MKRAIKSIFLLLFIGAAAYLGWMIYKAEMQNREYSDFGDFIPEDYPILGMDVSHYQGDINWDLVKSMRKEEDSIQFVFIKATEGLSIEDDKKQSNAEGARSVEIDYGFYHFFHPELSARAQADFFADEIGGYNFDLRPVIDVEKETSFSSARLRDSITVFLDRVEERVGSRPIVYTYYNLFFTHFRNYQETFWVAKYSRSNPTMENDNVICWQFSEIGTVDGINENVDLNVGKENFFEKISR